MKAEEHKEKMNLNYARQHIERALGELEEIFQPYCKLTFIMRNPKAADGDMIITSDHLVCVKDAIEKLMNKTEWKDEG